MKYIKRIDTTQEVFDKPFEGSKVLPGFEKNSRSGFKYWFAHWCSYQTVALGLGIWKFKYLFHDILKPWHKLICKDYKKVQKFHRTHSKHHVEYYFKHGKIDVDALIIDWECSRFTKTEAQLDAAETLKYEDKIKCDNSRWNELYKIIDKRIKELGL